MADKYTDAILGAVDIIVDGKLKGLQADQTIECLIIDTSQAKDRIYTVQNENAKFKAYSTTSDTYYKNDTVYVMVPQGNYSKQKFITGRKVDPIATENTYSMKLPFDDFIGLQYLNEGTEIEEKGFLANCKEQYFPGNNNLYTWIKGDNNNQALDILGTKLGISCKVQTLMGSKSTMPNRGDYGLEVKVTGYVQEERSEPQLRTVLGYFKTEDMYGNPYLFYEPYTQEKIFDISQFMTVEKIEINFWQDYNFYDQGGRRLTYATRSNAEISDQSEILDNELFYPPNILISNLNLYIGLTSDEISEEKTFLYTYGNAQYGNDALSDTPREDLDTRTLKFAWVHRNANQQFVLINDEKSLNDLNEKNEIGINAHIHWFHKDNNIVVSNQVPASYGGRGWEYLGEQYDDKFEIDYLMDLNRSNEQFKVVVAYYSTYETSDALIFRNAIDVETANEAVAASNEVVFRFLTKRKVFVDENGNIHYDRYVRTKRTDGIYETVDMVAGGNWTTKEQLVEDSTIGEFYVYDNTNRCIKNSDEEYWADKDYYIQVWIKHRANDESVDDYYIPLPVATADGEEPKWSIEWHFPTNPINQTMIQSYSDLQDIDFERLDLTNLSYGIGDTKEERIKLVKQITRKFRIKKSYDESYHENTISAFVTRNGREYYPTKELHFGNSSSTGSEYTITITQDSPASGGLQYTEYGPCLPFTFTARIHDRFGEEIPEDERRSAWISWQVLGPSTIEEYNDGAISEDGAKNYVLSSSDGLYIDNRITGYLRNEYPPVVKITVSNLTTYPITQTRGFLLTSDDFNYSVSVPSRIEYKSDGTVPVWDNNSFNVIGADGEDNYIDWELKEYNNKVKEWLEQPETARLISTEVDKKTLDTNSNNIEVPAYSKYSLAMPDDREGWYWTDNKDEEQYLVLCAEIDSKKIRQSIAIGHNQYSSSLINDWDGTLNIDKQNNSIMSRTISAGTKDNNNRFTGIMMGDWNDNADISITGKTGALVQKNAGLFGMIQGEQSFGLRTDGTGFIGKASNGQITFDGNNALISDNRQDFYINLNPIRYEYNDSGAILKNNKNNFSPYFLYAKSKKTADTNSAHSDLGNVESKFLWAKSFSNDVDNDYFIVDPNNGVYISGGISADYGRIGNWGISNQGLYQKGEGKYMFIGYNPKSADNNKEDATDYAIFAGDNEFANPYFTVSWDGTLFARKGLIGNTWSIDDNGLTQEKNNGIIYIGNSNEVKTLTMKSNFPNNNELTTESVSPQANDPYSILGAMKITASDNPQVNFGLTQKGFLYSRFGKIGGWNINNMTLTSDDNTIILDSNNKQLNFNNGTTVIYGDGRVKLGQTSNGVAAGSVQLVNYILKGAEYGILTDGINQSATLATSSSNVDITNKNYSITTDYKDTISWDISSKKYGTITNSANILGNGSIYSARDFKILDINGSTTYDFTSKDTTSVGVVVLTGQTSSTNSEQKAVAFYPQGNANNYASLGISGHRWNVMAGIIDANDLQVNNINVKSDSIYMQGHKVATQDWVYNELNDVYNAIKSASGGAASSIGKIGGGLGNIGQALTLFNNHPMVSGISITQGSTAGRFTYKYNGFGITFDNKGIYGATGTAEVFTDTSRSFEVTIPGAVTGIKFKDNGNGTIGLTVNSTGNLEHYDSFNIAATQFYKDRAYAAYGGVAGNKTDGYININSKSGKRLEQINVSLTDGGNNTINARVGGTTIARFSVQYIYNNGYNKGYSDGEDSVDTSVSIQDWNKSGNMVSVKINGTWHSHQF